MSLLGATILTAIATAVLAAFAIVTAGYARQAFLKQSQEVRDQAKILKVQSDQLAEQRRFNEQQTKVLSLQADELRESLDERKREAAERRQAQASKVFVWQDHVKSGPMGETVTAHVKNTSDQPVYELQFSWHVGDLPPTRHQRQRPLIPGEEVTNDAAVPDGFDPDEFGVAAIFRDRAGIWWRTRPNGRLEELPPGGEPPRSW
jgi:hypothetical protein